MPDTGCGTEMGWEVCPDNLGSLLPYDVRAAGGLHVYRFPTEDPLHDHFPPLSLPVTSLHRVAG